MVKRILILMSDTGGGHRAVANAIHDALKIRHGDNAEIDIVDVFRDYTPAPLKYAPDFYPTWINKGKLSWGLGYQLTNSKGPARTVTRSAYLTLRQRIKQMLRDYPADVIVSAHALFVSPSLDALMSFEDRPPFVVVVTDLVSTHMFWYDTRADRILVPTKPALDRGLRGDVPADKMRITGLPVNPSFAARLIDKQEARAELGWLPDKLTVLMVGGGEGMGPLYRMARAINERELDIQLVVVAGKNKQLKARLEASLWNQPTRIYPFTRQMPRLMSAADMIVTKAGAASVTEATTAGLPLIISDVIPGQETGNMTYVVENGAGAYAPTPAEIGETVERWVKEGREGLAKRAEASRRIARPDAAFDVADEVWEWANYGRMPTNRRSIRNRLNDITSQFTP